MIRTIFFPSRIISTVLSLVCLSIQLNSQQDSSNIHFQNTASHIVLNDSIQKPSVTIAVNLEIGWHKVEGEENPVMGLGVRAEIPLLSLNTLPSAVSFCPRLSCGLVYYSLDLPIKCNIMKGIFFNLGVCHGQFINFARIYPPASWYYFYSFGFGTNFLFFDLQFRSSMKNILFNDYIEPNTTERHVITSFVMGFKF